jgi:signal transduction histidine kinase
MDIFLAVGYFSTTASKDIVLNYTASQSADGRKRAETELLQTNTSLQTMTERLIQMKDEFLTNTSHELQTPLNGIINISETLAEGNYGVLNQKQIEELQVILAVSRKLSSLITDIIDIEKIKRNEIQLNSAPLDIKAAIAMVVDVFRQNSIRHGLMKRKNGGRVKIAIQREMDKIGITVEDNGIGIEDPGAVFQRKDSLKQKGGVGLSNIKLRLMKYYGTELHFISNTKEGTKVYFTIPDQRIG